MFPKSLFRLLPAGLLLFTGARSGAQPPTTIDLDAIPAVELHLERTISDQGEPLFTGGFGCTIAYDHYETKLYVSDRNEIHIIADDGTLLRTVGRAGQGPGEFQLIQRILPLQEQIFVADGGNHRLTIFDKNFTYRSSIPLRTEPNDLAFVPKSGLLLFHSRPRQPADKLLHSLDPAKPLQPALDFIDTIDSFEGFNAGMFMLNTLRIAATGDQLFAFHRHLPLLRIIDMQSRQQQQVRFRGEAVERLNKPLEIQGSPQPGVVFVFRAERGPDGLIYWGQLMGKVDRIFAFDETLTVQKAYALRHGKDDQNRPFYIDFTAGSRHFLFKDLRHGTVDVYPRSD